MSIDRQIKNLERIISADPDREEEIIELLGLYGRSNAFQLDPPRKCSLPKRGVFYGNVFGYFPALNLIREILKRGAEFGAVEEEDFDVVAISEQVAYEAKESWRNFPIHVPRIWFYTPAFPEMTTRGPAEYAEQDRQSFVWGAGTVLRGRRGDSWAFEGQRQIGIEGSSTVEIQFDYSIDNILPRCQIIYWNPTKEMEKLLCRLPQKFFSHKELPVVPPFRFLSYSRRYAFNDELEIRGELLMPRSIEDLKFIFRNIIGRDPESDDEWITMAVNTYPVLIQCPTCENIYSAYKDQSGYGDAQCYCNECEYFLLHDMVDNAAHINAFARQHQSGSVGNYPYFIPPDAPPWFEEVLIRRMG